MTKNRKVLLSILIVILASNSVWAMNKKAYKHYNSAENFYKANDFIRAEIEYRKAAEIDPGELLIYTKLAKLLSEEKQWDKALEIYRKAVELNPRDGYLHLNIGNILRIRKDYDGAYESYKNASTLFNEVYLNLAQLQSQKNNHLEAIEYYKIFLTASPDSIEARKSLASTYLGLNMSKEAVKEYETLLKNNNNTFEDWENYGKSLFLAENYKKIPEILSNAIKNAPDNPNLRIMLATAYVNLNEKEKALNEFKTALKLDSSQINLKFNIASLLDDLGKKDEAIEYYLAYIKDMPDNSDAYYNLGLIYQEKDDLKQSIAMLNKVNELKQGDANVLKEIGRNYYMDENFEEAINYYNDALKYNQDDPDLYYRIGLAYYLLNDYYQAIEHYKKSLALEDNDKVKNDLVKIYIDTANDYKQLNEYQNAVEAYTEAINLIPADKNLFSAFVDFIIEIGNIYKENANLQEAQNYYEQALSLDKENINAKFNLGLVAFETGNNALAKEYLKTVQLANSEIPFVYYLLGIILDKEKEYTGAVENYKKFLNLAPEDENASEIQKRLTVLENTRKR